MTIFRVPMNLSFPGAGSPGVNVWHIRTATITGSGELNEANTLIGYIRAVYVAIAPRFPTGMSVSLGTVTEEGTSREIVPTMVSVAGTGTGSAPQLLALVTTWRTSVAARRGRGRTFFGPLNTASIQSDGTPADAVVTDLRTACAALITSSTGFANGAVGVWGYDAAKTPGKANPRDPNDARVFRDFVGYQVRDLFGSLRSRRD